MSLSNPHVYSQFNGLMPDGEFKGKPLASLTLKYLKWKIANSDPSPLVSAMIEICNQRAKLTKTKIKITTKPTNPITTKRAHTIGEPVGELKRLIDESPEDLF